MAMAIADTVAKIDRGSPAHVHHKVADVALALGVTMTLSPTMMPTSTRIKVDANTDSAGRSPDHAATGTRSSGTIDGDALTTERALIAPRAATPTKSDRAP